MTWGRHPLVHVSEKRQVGKGVLQPPQVLLVWRSELNLYDADKGEGSAPAGCI